MRAPISDFATPRLQVRDWQDRLGQPEARAVLAGQLNLILTAPVLAPLPPSLALQGLSELDTWIEARRRESAVMTLERNSDGALVGLLLLAPSDANFLHVGYLLAENVWGQGVATEVLTGLVRAAASSRPITLVAGTSTANPASARVLEKAGFKLDQSQTTANTKWFTLRHG